MSERRFAITAEHVPTVHVGRWRRLWLKLRHQPLPRGPQPPGTTPVVFEYTDPQWRVRRIYIPAARIDEPRGWTEVDQAWGSAE